MRGNIRRPQQIHRTLVITILAFIVAALAGLVIGLGKLRALWLEQCIIRDAQEQVEITPGKMVKADVLAELIGLTNGANLAKIDFAAQREKVLRRIYNLRSITITRRLPDKVKVTVEERSPIAQLEQVQMGKKEVTGKVVDAEGMVFICQRGTRLLPIIRESQSLSTAVGHTLNGRSRAALHVLEICRDSAFSDIGVREIDTTKRDYLLLKIGNNVSVKLAWEGMDEETRESRRLLIEQLTYLMQAIRSRIGEGGRIWNATETTYPRRITVDGKGIF